jgi:hypothetical protein
MHNAASDMKTFLFFTSFIIFALLTVTFDDLQQQRRTTVISRRFYVLQELHRGTKNRNAHLKCEQQHAEIKKSSLDHRRR